MYEMGFLRYFFGSHLCFFFCYGFIRLLPSVVVFFSSIPSVSVFVVLPVSPSLVGFMKVIYGDEEEWE